MTAFAPPLPAGRPDLAPGAGPVAAIEAARHSFPAVTAVIHHGRGRAAVFGEAAMFSAQPAGIRRQPRGLNAPAAEDNPRLLRKVAWRLAGEGT